MTYEVVEIKKNENGTRKISTWATTYNTSNEAVNDINIIKNRFENTVFSVENSNGTIVEVIK